MRCLVALSLAGLALACSGCGGAQTSASTGPAQAGAKPAGKDPGRGVTSALEVSAILHAADERALVAGVDRLGQGLFWVDLRGGSHSAVAIGQGQASRLEGEVIGQASTPTEVFVTLAPPGSGGSRPGYSEGGLGVTDVGREVVRIDLASRQAERALPPGGRWAALTLRGDQLHVAQLDVLVSVPRQGPFPATPVVVGERIFNETTWLTWLGESVVSQPDEARSLLLSSPGGPRRSIGLQVSHPARWGDSIAGESGEDLVAWSPQGNLKVLVAGFVRSHGRLRGPLVLRGDQGFAATTQGLAAVHLGKGTAEIIVPSSSLAPGLYVGERSVWIAEVERSCSGRGRLATPPSERRPTPSSPRAEECVPSSRLRLVER